MFQQAWDKYNFLNEGVRGGPTDVDREAFQQAWDKYDFLTEGVRGGPTDVDREAFQQAWDKYNFLTEGTRGGPTDADRRGVPTGVGQVQPSSPRGRGAGRPMLTARRSNRRGTSTTS